MTSKSAETQAGVALHSLGIGDNVPLDQAMFLGWIPEKTSVIGFKYRSSQPGSDGIGENIEYFRDVVGEEGKVIRART